MTSLVLLYFIAGLALVTYGAKMLIDSTEKFSTRFNISHFTSSFIFIGLATSSPEIFISIIASINNKTNIAIGNSLGSNIANLGLVFALSLLFINHKVRGSNLDLSSEAKKLLIGLIILTSSLIPIMADGILSYNESVIIIIIFAILLYVFKNDYQNRKDKIDSKNNKITNTNYIFINFILD